MLACAKPGELDATWAACGSSPSFTWVRPPHFALLMVRGRVSATGVPFNLGEMTVTRCVLQIQGGILGFATISGRNKRHAALAALIDALLQQESAATSMLLTAIDELETKRQARGEAEREQAEASRPEFMMQLSEHAALGTAATD